MTWKQEHNFRNGFLALINIQIVVLHVEPKISHYLFQITGFGGHIGFCAYRPPGGYPNLYAVVFENLMPIPNTIPNCKNLSPSVQFLWIPSPAIHCLKHCGTTRVEYPGRRFLIILNCDFKCSSSLTPQNQSWRHGKQQFIRFATFVCII